MFESDVFLLVLESTVIHELLVSHNGQEEEGYEAGPPGGSFWNAKKRLILERARLPI